MSIPPRPPDADVPEAQAEPGRAAPHPGFFFNTPEADRLSELIRHLVENSPDVVLLVGEKGAGKTTLSYHMSSGAPAHWSICRVDANPMMRPDQLFAGLARCLSAPVDSVDGIGVLVAAFAARRLQGDLPVVVIDDAGQLPMGTLMALVRLHERGEQGVPPFALVMLAESSIDRTLTTQQFHAMGTARFKRLELPRLEYGQLEAYIHHFLSLEGVGKQPKLNPSQLDRIYQGSAGMPGRVNELVVQALRDPESAGMGLLASNALKRMSQVPPLTAASLLGLVLLLTATLVFQDQINALFEAPPDELSDKAPSEEAQDTPTSGRLTTALPLPPLQNSASQTDSATPAIAHRLADSAGASEPEVLEVDSEPLFLEPEAEVDTAVSSPPENVGQSQEPANPPPVDLESPRTTRTAVLDPPVDARPRPDAKRKTVAQPASPIEAKPLPKPKARIESARRAPTGQAATLKWLEAQRPSAYTLQILGVSEEQAALEFIRKGQFETDVRYFESSRNGKPWFAVLHGVYPDRKAATAALQKLPASLRKIGAWPRTLESVKAELKRH